MNIDFKIYDIISISKFDKKNVQGKPVIILKDIKQEKANVANEIGSPVDFEVNDYGKRLQQVKPIKVETAEWLTPLKKPAIEITKRNDKDLNWIADLNTNIHSWVIKARVTKKGDVV